MWFYFASFHARWTVEMGLLWMAVLLGFVGESGVGYLILAIGDGNVAAVVYLRLNDAHSLHLQLALS